MPKWRSYGKRGRLTLKLTAAANLLKPSIDSKQYNWMNKSLKEFTNFNNNYFEAFLRKKSVINTFHKIKIIIKAITLLN